MTKPASYPFMNIAKMFDVPYADVLAVAGRDTISKIYYDQAWWQLRNRGDVMNAIGKAVDEQELIRRGVIDWLTGEDIRLT